MRSRWARFRQLALSWARRPASAPAASRRSLPAWALQVPSPAALLRKLAPPQLLLWALLQMLAPLQSPLWVPAPEKLPLRVPAQAATSDGCQGFITDSVNYRAATGRLII